MRKEIFDAVRRAKPDVFQDRGHILALDNLLDAFGVSRDEVSRHTGEAGLSLIKSFEMCKLQSYPDPGSKDGNPWTIGWGTTGPDVVKGLTWTQSECDERFVKDLQKYEIGVERLLAGAPTTQNQFDALVSFAYNAGLEALAKSTLLRKHRAGDYAGAEREFAKWIYNDGQVMKGLIRRRMAEANLYGGHQ